MPRPRARKAHSRTQKISPVELEIRQLLRGKLKLDPASIVALIKLDSWAWGLSGSDPGRAMQRFPGAIAYETSADLIDGMTASFSRNARGLNKLLLQKSLTEAFVKCIGPESNPSVLEGVARIRRYLRRAGDSSLAQRFLSLYLFNIVWSRTCQSFQQAARSTVAFAEQTVKVDRTCQKIVISAWKKVKILEPLNEVSARQLIEEIERRLGNKVDG